MGCRSLPVGITQARVVVRGILGDGDAVYNRAITPSVVYSDPPLAAIGLTEDQAAARHRCRGARRHDHVGPPRGVWAPACPAPRCSSKQATGLIADHLLGHHAEEVINVFAAAIAGGLTAADIKAMPWAYPTGGWDIVNYM